MAISRIPITGTDPQQIQSALDRLVSEVNRSINAANDAKGQRLTNLSRPVSSNDAVSLAYMQDYVSKTVKSAIGQIALGTGAEVAEVEGIDLLDVRVTNSETGGYPPNKTWNPDGSLQLSGTREEMIGYFPGYIGPVHLRQIGQFQGVNIYWENAEEPTRPLFCGATEYTGSPAANAPDNIGEIDVTIPRGKLKVGDNYLHLRAYGETRRLKYYPHTLAPSQAYWKITITQDDLDGHPTTVVGTINPPTSVVTIVEDYGQEQVKYGCRWTAPDPAGATVGYEVEFRFYNNSGDGNDQDYYRTFAGYVDGVSSTSFYVTDPQPRDSKTVYVRAFVRAFNEDREYGDWVAGTTVPVLPIASGPGQFPGAFSVALTIEPVEAGPAHFWALVDLTPPTYVGGAIQWENEMGYFEQETGGAMTSEWIPLSPPHPLSETQKMYGPFVRAIGDPLSPPWGQIRTRLILGNGAKTDYVYSTRKVITYAAAPTPTLNNQSYITYDTVNGVPSYYINRKVTFSGDKTGVDWTNMIAFFYTDSGGTVVDGEIPLGGIDPSLYDAWPITVEDRIGPWPVPNYDVWYKIGVAAYNAANTEGTWYYTTLAKMNKANGFDTSGIDPSTVGPGLTVDEDGLASLSRSLMNGDFEFGLTDWNYSAQWTADTAEAYKGTAAKCTCNGTDQYLCQDLPVAPGQVVRFEAWAKESGNSTSSIQIIWYNASSSVISTLSTTITGDTYALYAVAGTAPANAATARVNIAVPAANSSGRVMVDQATFTYLEPVTGPVTRTSSGMSLNLDGASLVVVDGNLTTLASGVLAKLNISDHFTKAGGLLAVNAIAVNYLLAGTAVFTGTVRFERSSGAYIEIGSTYVTIYSPGQGYAIFSSLSLLPALAVGGESDYSITANVNGVSIWKPISFFSGADPYFQDPAEWRTALGLGTAATQASTAFAAATHGHPWSAITDKPTVFPPDTHNHDSAYASIGHTHYYDAGDIAFNDYGQTTVAGALQNIFSRLAAHGI